jgi:site-specific DNA-methyltransferase (adenine-specific)
MEIKNNKNDSYILADFLDYIKKEPEESFDLVIADPPYFKVKGDFDFIWKTHKEYLDFCREWLLECKRVLKPNGSLILWGSVGEKQITFARLAIMIEDENIFYRRNWITQGNKRGIGAKTNYMSAREDFLFLVKDQKNFTFNIPYKEEASTRKDLGKNGKPRKNKFKRVSNVWSDITEASQSSLERSNHPTIKAIKLCDRLIQAHSNEGDKILIPFGGSGSEFISAINNNRSAVATELDPKYFNDAKDKIIKFVNNIYHLEDNKKIIEN